MPRVLLDVEAFLGTLQSPLDVASDDALRRLVAATALLLAYFFGWRDDTCGHLSKLDLSLEGQVLHFSERFSKGAFSRARHLFRRLTMELGSSPPFARAFSILCVPEVWNRLPNTIFAFVSSGKRKLEACLQLVLREIVQTGSV